MTAKWVLLYFYPSRPLCLLSLTSCLSLFAGAEGERGRERSSEHRQLRRQARRRVAAAVRGRRKRHREFAQLPLQSESGGSALGRSTGQEAILLGRIQKV